MGNSNSQEASFVLNAKSLEEWTKIEEQGFCELWMHKKSQKQLQAYPIPESFARNEDQLRKYNLRKSNNQHLVSVEAIVTPGDSFLCSEPRLAYALVENINCRLRHYKGCLSLPQSLYVLTASASGYNTLNSFFGPIDPHPDMICFNQEGKVKVWLNENLSLNEASLTARSPYPPSDDYNTAQKRTKEGVDKLIRMVELSSRQGFSSQFKEQCKKVSTYFEVANLVPYFCEKNNIDLPDQVQVPIRFSNPVFRPQRELVKDQSMPILSHNNSQNLDVSRVKTVAIGSSQIIQPSIANAPQRTYQRQWSINHQTKQRTSIRMSTQQSPKITFSIRASLPSPIQNNQSPIKSIMREVGMPVMIPKRNSQVGFGQITPPQQKVVMQKIQRKSNKSSEGRKSKENSEPRQKQITQLTFTQVQVPVSPEVVESEKKTVEQPRQEQMESKGNDVTKEVSHEEVKEEKNIENHSSEVFHQSAEKERLTSQQEVQNFETILPPSENVSEKQILPRFNHQTGSKEENYHIENYNFYHHELCDRQVLTSELEMPSYKTSEKSIEVSPVERITFLKQAQSSKNSQFSNVQPYIPSSNYNMDSPIIEQLEENLSSPRRDNSDIEEWQAKLNKFSNSKHSQLKESEQKGPYCSSYDYQESNPLKPVKVENEFDRPKVPITQPVEEHQVNELVHLEGEDIESYIRAKYNLGKKQVETPTDRSYPSVGITKIESIYYKINKNGSNTDYPLPYNVSYTASNALDYPEQKNDDEYKLTSYKNQYQFDNPSKYDSNYSPYSFNRPSKDQNYEFTFKKYSDKLDYDYIEKENYLPTYNLYNDCQQNDGISIQLSQETGTYRTSLPSFAPEERGIKKESQKYRARNSDTSKIEERYNKYVVNGPRRTSNRVSGLSNQKEVSLLLTQGKDISGISPKHMPSELNESSKRGIHDFILGGDHFKQGVTYQKLRNLLWED